MGKNNCIAFRVTIAFLILQCFSCGEDENVCQQAVSVQKKLCGELVQCFPCNCILNDKIGVFVNDPFGMPDLSKSYCQQASGTCEGTDRANAEQCVKDNTSCDPKFYKGIRLFSEDGHPTAAFPEICSFE